MAVPLEARAMEKKLRISRHSDSQAGSLRLLEGCRLEPQAALTCTVCRKSSWGGTRNISQQPNWDLEVAYSKDFIK